MAHRRAVFILAVLLASVNSLRNSRGAADTWDGNGAVPPHGNWETGINWADNSTPGNSDTATFSLASTYSVTFGAAPTAIQALTVNAGTVTFQSSGGAKTLSINSGGTQDFLVSGIGTSLLLGTSGNPLHLAVGDDLSVGAGATLEVRFGSDVSANDFGATGVNGTLRVDGSNSTLMLTGSALSVVGNSGTGSLIFQNGSVGNSMTNTLGLADTSNAGASGTLTISGGSTLSLDGDLRMAQRDVAGQSATLNINGFSSFLTQTGATSITVGAAVNGTAAINIGVAATGGTLTTGTGTLMINPTATVTIGSGADLGTLVANGDVVINDGVLERGSGSSFNLAPGKNMTIQNGGRATFNGSYITASNAVYNITGANSRLETIGGASFVNINSGAQVLVAAGGSISATNLNVGTFGAATLMVDGTGSSASSISANWGAGGGTANVTFSNNAVGTISFVGMADNSTAGTTANVNVLSGADVTAVAVQVAASGGTTTSGTFTVDGAGSTVVTSGGLEIGHGSQGTGTLNVTNGATFTIGPTGGLIDGTGVINITGGTLNSSGPIRLNDAGGTGTLSKININGAGGNLTQTGATTITVGQASGGTAAINIGTTASGGTVSTGTGLFTINPTGTVTLGSGANTGTLDLNGNMTIDGGLLQINNTSSNFIVVGSTVNIQNGGRLIATGTRLLAGFSIYNITGATSQLTVTGGELRIVGHDTVNVSNGGALSASGVLQIGVGGGDGTLTVTGAGSSAASSLTAGMAWGRSGDTATVTFSDNSTGAFGNVSMAHGLSVSDADSISLVTIESGADVSFRDINMANGGAAATSATLTATGAGSTVTLSPAGILSVGHSSIGTATVNALNGGALTVTSTGSTNLNATGTININGGSVSLGTLTDNGGTINFTAGSLSYLGNLTVGVTGLLGANLTLNTDRQLFLSGTTTVEAGQTLTLDGGTLHTGSMIVNGTFHFDSGTLGLVTPGGSINAPLVSNSVDSTINIFANNISLGSAASFTGFYHQGTLAVGTGSVTLHSAGYARLGALTVLVDGTISAPNGVYLPGGGTLIGSGSVNARLTGDSGSVIEASGALALGDAASPAGFNFDGELRTRQHAVTLNSSAQATLGNLTTLGSGASPGTLNATNGVIVDFGDAITGFGTINSTNTLAKRTIINGTAQGTSAGQPLTFAGYVKGVGSFNNVMFTGTFDPGLSPTILTVGNIALSPTSTLIMELGGTTPGSTHDQIQTSGQLALAGTLQVSLINAFTPSHGASFDLFNGTLSGTFSSLQLPDLPGTLGWDISSLYTTGALSVSAFLPGDFNRDGSVTPADIQAMLRALTDLNAYKIENGLNDNSLATIGDLNNSGTVTNRDIQLLLNLVPTLAGSGQIAAVPEPSALALCALGCAGFALTGQRLRGRWRWLVSVRSQLAR